MQKIIVSVTNDLVTDQRVKKICNSLQNFGFEITLIGRKLPNSLPISRDYKTIRMRLLFNKGFLFYAEYNLRLFLKLLFLKKDVLLANDLDTLLPNYLISKIFSKKLVYDSHELFTAVPELTSRPLIRNVWLNIENLIFPKLKNVYTVNNKIAEIYSEKYQIPVKVIKNVPYMILGNEKSELSFNADKKKIILYQGAINTGRGLELMIDTMPLLKNYLFVIIGDGDVLYMLKKQVNKLKLNDKVLFLGKILPENLPKITKNVDLGISLEEDLGLSYRFSLPNKVFDYIQSKIPILVSNLPIIRLLLDKFKVGEILVNRDPWNLAQVIEKMVLKKDSYQEQLKKAAHIYTWENEEKKLKEIYSNLK